MTSNLFKKHKVYFDGMHLPLEKCVKSYRKHKNHQPESADFWQIGSGHVYIKHLESFFLNIRSLEAMLIYCVSECVLTFSKKTSIDYRDIAHALGKKRNGKINFQFEMLLNYLRNKGNLREDFFNELDESIKIFQEIRNALFHANTTHSFHANVCNEKLYFNTSPIIDGTGVYAYVYEVNKNFFQTINKDINKVTFELLEITNNIN